ncbi:MAG: two-component regulator propeller domain-containing protein [Bacteroidales bacterium]
MEIYRNSNGRWEFVSKVNKHTGGDLTGSVYSLEEDIDGNIWMTTDDPNALYRLSMSNADTIVERMDQRSSLQGKYVTIVKKLDDDLFIGTADGLYRYEKTGDTIVREEKFLSPDLPSAMTFDNLFMDDDKDVWLSVSSPRNFIYYYPEAEGADGIVSRPFFMLPNTVTS